MLWLNMHWFYLHESWRRLLKAAAFLFKCKNWKKNNYVVVLNATWIIRKVHFYYLLLPCLQNLLVVEMTNSQKGHSMPSRGTIIISWQRQPRHACQHAPRSPVEPLSAWQRALKRSPRTDILHLQKWNHLQIISKCVYRDWLKGGPPGLVNSVLLLLTTSAWLCLQHSHNLEPTF